MISVVIKHDKLRRRIRVKKEKALGRAGAFARTLVRRSMRSGGKNGNPSKPGQPPRYQTGLLRDLLWAEVSESGDNVTVGPLYRKVNSGWRYPSPQLKKVERQRAKRDQQGKQKVLRVKIDSPTEETPAVLEGGGAVQIELRLADGQTVTVRATIEPRPYLQPAIPKAMAELKKQAATIPFN